MAGELSLALLITATDQASGIIGGVAKAFGPLGTGMLAIGTIAAGVGVEAIKMAGNFQQATNLLITSAGESASNIGLVQKGILALSVTTATSTDQLAAGMYMIESAGFHGAAGLQVLTAAAQGARAEGANLDTVGNALTTMLVDFHMGAGQATTAMNGLIATVGQGKTHLQDLASSMGTVLPIASALGLSFPQVAGALATLTNSGITAQHAAQMLAFAMRALAAPNNMAIKTMQQVGLTAQQVKDTMSQHGLSGALQLVSDAVGKKFPQSSVAYVEAMKHIMGGAVGYNTMLMLTGNNMAAYQAHIAAIAAAMKLSTGAVMGWDTVQGNLNFRLDQAKQAFNALLIIIGIQMLPAITAIATAVGAAISAFTAWLTTGNNMANAMHILQPILIAIGIVLAVVIVPALISLAVGVITAAAPFVLLVAAVAGAVAMFQHLYATNAGFASFINGIINGIKGLASLIGPAFNAVKNIVSQVAQAFQIVFFPAIQKVQAAAKPLLDTFSRATGIFKTVHSAVQPLFDTFSRAVSVLNPVTSAVKPMADSFDRASGIIRSTTQAANPFISIFQNVAALLKTVFSTVGAMIQASIPIFQGIWRTLLDIGGALKTSFMPVWQQLAAMWTSELLPDLQKLWAAFVPLLPVLKMIGAFILGVLIVAFGLLVGVIVGVVKGLAYFLEGLIRIIGGVVTLFTGLVQFLSGIITFIYDLLTGNFSKLGADLTMVMAGIVNMMKGTWETISGIFMAAWGLISGIVGGFVQGVIGFFQHLADTLVGHSIIPDMINAIIAVFQAFVALAMTIWNAFSTFLTNLWNTIKTVATTIWTALFTFLANLIQMEIAGFEVVWNAFSTFLTNLWNTIKTVATVLWNAIVVFLSTLIANFITNMMQLWNAFSTFLTNLWNTIKTVATTIWNALVATITALVHTAVTNIQAAWNSLIGIATTIFNNVKNTVLGILASLASAVFNAGMSIVQGIANGIMAGIGFVASAIGNVASFIASHLPNSPAAKVGALRNLEHQGTAVSESIASGMLKGLPHIQSAMAALTAPIAGNLSASSSFALGLSHSASFAISAGGRQPIIIQLAPSDINLDGRKVGESTMRYVRKELHTQGALRGL